MHPRKMSPAGRIHTTDLLIVQHVRGLLASQGRALKNRSTPALPKASCRTPGRSPGALDAGQVGRHTSCSGPPLPWIALPVQASDDDHDVIVEPIEDPVWESNQKGPPGISMDHRIQGGLCGNALKRGLKRCQKLIAEARTPAFVPQKRFVDIGGRCRTNDDGRHSLRLRMLRKTSSHGMPVGPSRSSSSSRRSNSSRWALVRGIPCGVARRLSQSSSISRNRSSVLRLAISTVPTQQVYPLLRNRSTPAPPTASCRTPGRSPGSFRCSADSSPVRSR